MMKDKEITALVREAFPMDARLSELLRAAWWDLHYGPHSAEDFAAEGIKDWPGYVEATDLLREWADETLGPVWVDTFAGYLLTSEPEGYTDEETGEWQEPNWEDFTALDKRDVERRIFGALVTEGGL